MDEPLKKRLVGAAVLVAAIVIFAPMVLDQGSDLSDEIVSSNIPERPADVFQSRIVPLKDSDVLLESPSGTPETGSRQPVQAALPARAPVPASAPSSLPASRQAATEAGRESVRVGLTAWAVQLGSFSNADNATALRERLRSQGFTAFTDSVYLNNEKTTRVYVGPELLRSKADAAAKRLESELKLKGLVVRYPGG